MPSTRHWSRRRLLEASAGAAVLSPFLRFLASDARAAETPPKRVIFVFGGLSIVKDTFYPPGAEGDWAITPSLMPLRDFKQQLTIPRGLKSHYGGPGSHAGGTQCFLTAVDNDDGGLLQLC